MSMENTFTTGASHAPIKWELRMNGTVTQLFRIRRGERSYWVGSPFKDGRNSRFKLIVGEDGKIHGSSPVNFIATGGRGKADETVYLTVRHAIKTAFLTHAKAFYTEEQALSARIDLADELAMFLGSGFLIDEGEMDDENLRVLGLLGVTYEVACIAATNGLCIRPIAETLLENTLNPAYSSVCDGEWDDMSEILAIAGGMTIGEVVLARETGLKIKRVPRAA